MESSTLQEFYWSLAWIIPLASTGLSALALVLAVRWILPRFDADTGVVATRLSWGTALFVGPAIVFWVGWFGVWLVAGAIEPPLEMPQTVAFSMPWVFCGLPAQAIVACLAAAFSTVLRPRSISGALSVANLTVPSYAAWIFIA